MSLFIQIKMILITFIYGLFFSFTFNLSKKVLLDSKRVIKLLLSSLFMIDHTLLYFILIRFINNSILHIYLFIFFILGIYFYRHYFTYTNKTKLT